MCLLSHQPFHDYLVLALVVTVSSSFLLIACPASHLVGRIGASDSLCCLLPCLVLVPTRRVRISWAHCFRADACCTWPDYDMRQYH